MTHGTHNPNHSSPKSPIQSWSPKASVLGSLCDSKQRRHINPARGFQANAVYMNYKSQNLASQDFDMNSQNFAGRNLINQNIRILEL